MKIWSCYIKKPDNPRTAIMVVFTDQESDVESTIHNQYGEHLIVSNIEPISNRTAFQIGGDLVAVRLS